VQCNATRPNGQRCRSNAVKDDEKCARHNDGERKPGTAPKLTSELADRLVALLQAGNYVAVAAREVGISRAVFYQWIDRGASSAAVDRPYRELRERVEHAKAQAEARNVASIANAARQNWQAAAWLLERQYPDRWGRTSVRLRDTPVEDAPQVERAVDDDDPFREVDELAERRRRTG
jgi:hypothetical protein